MNLRSTKTLVIGAVTAATLAGAGIYGANAVHAQSTDNNVPPIVQKLADTFHLNVTDVENVFKQDREEMQAKHEQAMDDRLQQAVTDGKLTQAQKDELVKLLEENRPDKEDFADLTPEEHRDVMDKHHEALKQWFEDNNLKMEDILPVVKFERGFHGGGPGERGMMMKFEKPL